MTSAAVGLAELELRPAFLMLASCYTDLGKRVQAQAGLQTNASRDYMAKAQEYLQKVYGADSRSLSTLSTAGMTGLTVPAVRPSSGTPAATVAVPQCTTNTSGVVHGKDGAMLRIRTLERGIQSLKDKHSHSLATLSEIRDAKQKAEDEIARERDARRKVEKDLEEAILALQGARHAEKCALDQCKREVENRRRAEEKAADARTMKEELRAVRSELSEKDRKMRENVEREKRRKELCARAGAMLIKAASGELQDIANVIGSSTCNATNSTSAWALPTPHVGAPLAGPSRRERTASASSRYERSSPISR